MLFDIETYMNAASTLGDFHPILVHFPIVLFTLGLVCDLLNGIGKKQALPVAHWMIISGAILLIPTLFTGWEASQEFPPSNPYIPTHMVLGFITGTVGMMHGLFRFALIHKHLKLPPLAFISCSLLTLGLIAATANFGGLIVYGISPFSDLHSHHHG